MRSLPLKAATTVMLLAGVWACGDDNGGVGPGNTAPVAAFDAPACTVGAACSFTDKSSDLNGAADITTRLWEFGDGGTSPDQNPTHIYNAPGDYQVKLTVTDAAGASSNVTHTVTASATTANVPPTASFTPPVGCTVGVPCAFIDGSTDTDGEVTGWSWNFGDLTAPDPNQNPSHTFNAEGDYQVTLTVTDNLGATAQTTQTVTIAAATAQNCAVGGTTVVTCTLTMPARSTVNVTLSGVSCQITGDKVDAAAPGTVGAPTRQTLWFNVCTKPVGDVQPIDNAGGAPLVLEAGAQLQIRFTQGIVDAGDPIPAPPAARMTGTGPTWTIEIDDGGNPAGLGEPDFDDVVLQVQATAAP